MLVGTDVGRVHTHTTYLEDPALTRQQRHLVETRTEKVQRNLAILSWSRTENLLRVAIQQYNTTRMRVLFAARAVFVRRKTFDKAQTHNRLHYVMNHLASAIQLW